MRPRQEAQHQRLVGHHDHLVADHDDPVDDDPDYDDPDHDFARDHHGAGHSVERSASCRWLLQPRRARKVRIAAVRPAVRVEGAPLELGAAPGQHQAQPLDARPGRGAVSFAARPYDSSWKNWNTLLRQRSDGQYAGTTDEIFQWAACKWGLPDDLLRAVAVQIDVVPVLRPIRQDAACCTSRAATW